MLLDIVEIGFFVVSLNWFVVVVTTAAVVALPLLLLTSEDLEVSDDEDIGPLGSYTFHVAYY